MESSTNISRVKLRKISVVNLSLIYSLFGLVGGLIGGIPFFIFIRVIIEGWGMNNVPASGLMVLSFFVFPIVMGILFFVLGLVSGLLINLSLKIIKGLNMSYEELN